MGNLGIFDTAKEAVAAAAAAQKEFVKIMVSMTERDSLLRSERNSSLVLKNSQSWNMKRQDTDVSKIRSVKIPVLSCFHLEQKQYRPV